MTRGRCTFRQRDVTRAIRAVFASGACRAEIRIGEMIITADKTLPENVRVDTINEWDAPHGESAK